MGARPKPARSAQRKRTLGASFADLDVVILCGGLGTRLREDRLAHFVEEERITLMSGTRANTLLA